MPLLHDDVVIAMIMNPDGTIWVDVDLLEAFYHTASEHRCYPYTRSPMKQICIPLGRRV
jgi:hypothetical protein